MRGYMPLVSCFNCLSLKSTILKCNNQPKDKCLGHASVLIFHLTEVWRGD